MKMFGRVVGGKERECKTLIKLGPHADLYGSYTKKWICDRCKIRVAERL